MYGITASASSGTRSKRPERVVGFTIAREARDDRLVGVGELGVGERRDARRGERRDAARSRRVDHGLGARRERRAEDGGNR